MSKVDIFLEDQYNISIELLGSNNTVDSEIEDDDLLKNLNDVLENSESSKGVFTVVLTSLIYKIFYPTQDIRLHQANMKNGYSGRSFDSTHITPFLKSKNFPAMADSGWLTRSLEQNRAYDNDYPGSIRPAALKGSFLKVIHYIQSGQYNDEILKYIFQYLIIQRNSFKILLAKPKNLLINQITELLKKHFESKYNSEGASRLPSLAFYAIYQTLINELKRFENKQLLSLASHTSADARSGRIGDIDIIDEKGRSFEAVEIKLGIQINLQLVKDAYSKFKTTMVDRYYILSTADIQEQDKLKIAEEIANIKKIHGCQVIVNGIYKTLLYYLRLMNDTSDFIENYVKLIEIDNDIKFEHKSKWNDLINSLF